MRAHMNQSRSWLGGCSEYFDWSAKVAVIGPPHLLVLGGILFFWETPDRLCGPEIVTRGYILQSGECQMGEISILGELSPSTSVQLLYLEVSLPLMWCNIVCFTCRINDLLNYRLVLSRRDAGLQLPPRKLYGSHLRAKLLQISSSHWAPQGMGYEQGISPRLHGKGKSSLKYQANDDEPPSKRHTLPFLCIHSVLIYVLNLSEISVFTVWLSFRSIWVFGATWRRPSMELHSSMSALWWQVFATTWPRETMENTTASYFPGHTTSPLWLRGEYHK